MDMDTDDETARFHDAQSHLSDVEQSEGEDAGEDVAHEDDPMADGVSPAVEVPTVEVPTANIADSSAQPFRFGTRVHEPFDWNKRELSSQPDETPRKVILKEVDKSIDLRTKLGISEQRWQKKYERITETLTAKECRYQALQESNERNLELLKRLIDEATKKVEGHGAEIAQYKQQMEAERERHRREQAAKEEELKKEREDHQRKQAQKESEVAAMVARIKQANNARPANTHRSSTPQATTRDGTTTSGPSNHGLDSSDLSNRPTAVPDHTRPIPASVNTPPNRPTVPASHKSTQPVPTSADTEQRQTASEPATDILGTIRNIRRKHRRTNINTVLVIDEKPEDTETKEDEAPSILQNLGDVTERQRTLAHDIEALLPGVAQAVTKFMNSSTVNKNKMGKARAKEKARQESATEDRSERLAYLRAIKSFLRDVLEYEHNEDFVAHRPATQAEVEAFFANEGPGPDLEDLHFDMTGGLASDWNKRAFYLLTEKFCRELEDRKDLPARSKVYINKLISDQFIRLATIWKAGQRKLFDDDTWETNEELEARWTMRKDAQTHTNRHAVRRFSKLRRRLHIIDFKIRAAEDSQSDDLMLWKWLRDLMMTLGTDGMSSEESDVDRTLNVKVLRVNVQAWRRPGIDNYVEIIDAERQIDEGGHKPAGSKPIPRIRATYRNKISTRKPAVGLPAALYNETWLADLDDYDRDCILQVSPKTFPWLNFHSERRQHSSIS